MPSLYIIFDYAEAKAYGTFGSEAEALGWLKANGIINDVVGLDDIELGVVSLSPPDASAFSGEID